MMAVSRCTRITRPWLGSISTTCNLPGLAKGNDLLVCSTDNDVCSSAAVLLSTSSELKFCTVIVFEREAAAWNAGSHSIIAVDQTPTAFVYAGQDWKLQYEVPLIRATRAVAFAMADDSLFVTAGEGMAVVEL